MNFVLCGMMGSGKTTVGVRLAALTARTWIDTDALIEEKHGKISDIFAQFGEAYFRALEGETVRALEDKENLVLSVGGGLVLNENNVKLLKQKGKIIFLRAKKETLIQRLRSDSTRPLLQGQDSLENRIESLIRTRERVYARVADFTVDVDGKSPEEIAAEIVTACAE